ncbi:MAG: thioredoxin [Desulfobulbaceae bacterium DB1]|nr:MAG: thioredoxin [Desulfobulbaceae bacterium DB1]
MSILHVVCPVCGSVNRLAVEKAAEGPVCGKCRNRLFSGQPVALTNDTFAKHIERNDIPVVVDFWAPWCGPCKMMGPVFAQAAAELEPRVRLAKVDTEQEQALAARFAIRSIPTIVLFKNGREIVRQAGAMDQATLLRWVRSHL